MQGIVLALDEGRLPGSANVVISNNRASVALQFAKDHAIPRFHISEKKLGSYELADQAICDTLREHDVTVIILSGYMKKIGPKTLAAFPGKIINVHPSLLPQYAGLWGDAVHEAVLKDKKTVTGVTLHRVDAEYDTGEILWQSEVPVLEDDTIESLKKRVQQEETKAFIALLAEVHLGKIRM